MTDERREWEAELEQIDEAIAESESTPTTELAQRKVQLETLLAAGTELEPLEAPEIIVAPVDAEPDDFQRSGRELVVTSPDDVFEVLDRHDENLILDELKKRATKTLFYDFEQGGKRLIDLSIKGVLECIGLMNRTGKCRVAVDPRSADVRREVIDEKEYIVARVYAIDAVSGFGVYGTARQPMRMTLRNGKEQFDPFAETKALNKAQRNALGMLIPQKIRSAMIAQATGNVALAREIAFGVGAAEVAELPPPLADERALELTAACKSTFDELVGMNVQAMMPGKFHVELTRAAHSHDALEALLDRLVAHVAHERLAVTS